MSDPDVVLFRFVGKTVENAIAAFVEPAANHIISTIGATALIGSTLYLSIVGALIIAGYLSNPFWDVMKTCIKIAVVSSIALSAGNYMSWVVGSIDGIQTGLAGALNTLGGPSPSSIYETLDKSLGKALSLMGECFKHANESGWDFGTAAGWLFSGGAIGLGALFFTFLGGAIIIMAKFSLAALFALGPLFIMCLMWPATARFFDAWFSQVMNYVFTIVFAALFMSFALAAFDRFVSGADVSGDGTNSPAFAALQILGCTGIFSYLLLKSSEIAGGLAGGASMAALTIRQMVSPAAATARVVNPTSNRLDPKTGLQTSSGRAEHLYMGRSIINPAYRKAVADHRTENRGKNTVQRK
jgi:type IV secretion system protein VirB6